MRNSIITALILSILSFTGCIKDGGCPIHIPVISITLDKTELILVEGDETILISTITPENASNKTVVWESSDPSIATVDETGRVTAKSLGMVGITATADDKSATCAVFVVPNTIPVTGISLSKSEITHFKTETETLIATITPINATSQVVLWESSNPSIATVDQSGNVTALSLGMAIISAKADNKIATCTVNVVLPKVFVAGHETISPALYFRATVWEDGVPYYLTDGNNQAEALSVFVSNGDVYAVGYEYQAGIPVAKIWKNGVQTNLSNGTYDTRANSVFVSNNDVYVVGTETNGTVYTAKLWKNGVVSNLLSTDISSTAKSVFVDGNDVYVGGARLNASYQTYPVIWKNGVGTSYTPGGFGAWSIFVSGTTQYFVGCDNTPQPQLWTNGVATTMPTSGNLGQAYSVYVSDGDVYVSGMSNFYATIWKNGVPTTLSTVGVQSEAYSVVVAGGDTYAAGTIHTSTSIATYWKNEVPTYLSNGTNYAEAWSIFVAK